MLPAFGWGHTLLVYQVSKVAISTAESNDTALLILHRPPKGRQPLDFLATDLAQAPVWASSRVHPVSVSTNLTRPGAGRGNCSPTPAFRSSAILPILSLCV
jgi:hypothetical protein